MAASEGDDREGEALRRSEERYRTLYESARDAIVIVRDGLIVDCNRQALALFGFPSLRETVGRPVVDLRTGASPFSSPLNPPPTDRLAAAMRGEPQRFEWRIVRDDRAELDLDVSLSRLPLADGEALLVVARDITEMADEKRLQETLLALNTMHAASLRQVLDYALESALTLARSPIGYIFFYDETRERFTVYAWSGSAMRQCGISERQLEYELRGTGLWGEAVRQRRAVITNDYAAPGPLKKGIPEGHVPITRHLNVPVLDSGRIVLVAGVGNKAAPYTEADARNLAFLMAEAWKIASHQQIEAALRESEEHFRSFIRFAPVPIVITDERGRFEHLNDRFTRTFGYTLEDLPDLETWWRRAYPDEEYREEVLGGWREAMEAGRWTATRSNPLEYRVTCRDGSTRVAEVSSNHIGDRYLYLFNDLTGRKRAEEAMSRLQEQYLQAQKMEAIGRLAGGVAHDFNNLLTAILGYAEMIGTEQALPPLAREGIEEIEKSARRAAALTQQLLAFGRKQLLQPRVVDLNGLLADLEKMLRRLIGEDILLTSSLEAAGALVLADPGQVEQAIINLAVNARDAMPRGGTLTIGTRNASVGDEQEGDLAEVQPGEYVVLSVQDTGQGMDEKVRAHLFEPFFTTKEVGKGTGLGLSTVYGIVKQSGGHIVVHSEQDRGTRFDLYLPQAAPLPADKGERPPAAAPRMGLETILLVEDEEALLEMTARMLVRYGYSVVKTRGPAEALERLRAAEARRVDLLLTDVIMPGMSGRELADQAERLRPGLRVLFISGYTDDTILHHGVLDEGVAFLQKPFAPASLARKVREVLDR